MEYEYKTIVVGDRGSRIIDSDVIALNTLYANGWQFVESTCQRVSSSSLSYAPILYTLKKAKPIQL